MHLLIDGQALQTSSSRQRGIGRYSSNLLRVLSAARPNWRIELVQNRVLPPIAPSDRHGLPILSFSPPLPCKTEDCELNERYYADWLTARHADAVLFLSHCETWDAVVPTFCGPRPCVFGIAYDVIPLRFPEQYLTTFTVAHWYAHRFRQLLASDALLAISAATAQDVRALSDGEAPVIVNIGGAVDPLFAPLSAKQFAVHAERLRRRFGLQRDFLLYVGAADYRKNLAGAVRAFGALPASFRASLDLALVCRLNADQRADLSATARQADVASQLRLIPSVRDEELRALYQMCRLFFFPSLYEGLGLPVLEALHCGAPVVTSDCSALPEYAGPVSWQGDPQSPAVMARLLEEALSEPREKRAAERMAFARSFSWSKTAERACAVMERTVNRSDSTSKRRLRLALVAPLTELSREHSEYNEAILRVLQQQFDVERILPAGHAEKPKALCRPQLILTAEELRARHAVMPYDSFVYVLGPSRLPSTLDLLNRFPGMVLLHDVSLTDLRRLVERGALAAATTVYRLSQPLDSDRLINCIHRAILRHEQSGDVWRGFAVDCLADCVGNTDAILDSWALLRAKGQAKYGGLPHWNAAQEREPELSGQRSL